MKLTWTPHATDDPGVVLVRRPLEQDAPEPVESSGAEGLVQKEGVRHDSWRGTKNGFGQLLVSEVRKLPVVVGATGRNLFPA